VHNLVRKLTELLIVEFLVVRITISVLCPKNRNLMTVIILVGFCCEKSRTDHYVLGDFLG